MGTVKQNGLKDLQVALDGFLTKTLQNNRIKVRG